MLYLIHLIYLESRFKSCSKPALTKCNSEPLEKKKDVTKQRCEEMCEENDKCNFIFWNTGRFCALFETCDKASIRPDNHHLNNDAAKDRGIIFAKNSCPGAIVIFYVSTVIEGIFNWVFYPRV